jgi:hypothetical protein
MHSGHLIIVCIQDPEVMEKILDTARKDGPRTAAPVFRMAGTA